MAIQVRKIRTEKDDLEHKALTEALENTGVGAEREAHSFGKMSDVLWRMSENFQPLLHCLDPFWELGDQHCPQHGFKEKSEFDGFRMGL